MVGKPFVKCGKTKKTPQIIGPKSYKNCKVVWMFDLIDKNGPYAFNIEDADFKHKDFIEKMINYSSMTWDEIDKQTHDKGKSKNHYLKIDSINNKAIQRLDDLKLETKSDDLYSIAFTNILRIIGIREDDRFHILWYDKNHEVCPSSKKHT